MWSNSSRIKSSRAWTERLPSHQGCIATNYEWLWTIGALSSCTWPPSSSSHFVSGQCPVSQCSVLLDEPNPNCTHGSGSEPPYLPDLSQSDKFLEHHLHNQRVVGTRAVCTSLIEFFQSKNFGTVILICCRRSGRNALIPMVQLWLMCFDISLNK